MPFEHNFRFFAVQYDIVLVFNVSYGQRILKDLFRGPGFLAGRVYWRGEVGEGIGEPNHMNGKKARSSINYSIRSANGDTLKFSSVLKKICLLALLTQISRWKNKLRTTIRFLKHVKNHFTLTSPLPTSYLDRVSKDVSQEGGGGGERADKSSTGWPQPSALFLTHIMKEKEAAGVLGLGFQPIIWVLGYQPII
jgi:hypothetical protein